MWLMDVHKTRVQSATHKAYIVLKLNYYLSRIAKSHLTRSIIVQISYTMCHITLTNNVHA